MTGWRNCCASLQLLAEVNTRWPQRNKESDGTIGDAAHASRDSDHNPWVIRDGQGIVRARDITAAGIDASWLAEYLRGLGARGDRRLIGGGYIIFNRRITAPDWSGWRTYTGANPHTHHVHVSFSRDPAGFDSTQPWGIAEEDDMFTDQDRAALNALARRVDVGYARDQVLARLGVVDTVNAPIKLTPEQAASVEPARRGDVGYARDQLAAQVAALDAKVNALITLLTEQAARS